MTGYGGKRFGAGRPKGCGKFGEGTTVIRLPCSKITEIQYYLENKKSRSYQLPLYLSKVSAGFPSPGDDYIECQLDLNEHLIKHIRENQEKWSMKQQLKSPRYPTCWEDLPIAYTC